MKKTVMFAVTLLMGTVTTAFAQSAQDIINKVDAMQKAAKDVTFRLTGTFTQNDSAQKIDVKIQTIPALKLARIDFAAPDSLADNIVVMDEKEVRQYMFLTNQITVTSTKKAASDALKGSDMGSLDFNSFTDFASLLKDYDVKLVSSSGASGQKVYVLDVSDKKGKADFTTRVSITEAGWRPTRIQALDSKGKLVADLKVSNYKMNSGLKAATLKALPKDAEIIRQ